MAYLDYIIIFSKDEKEHLEHLRIIFQRLQAAGLKLKRSKCDFMKRHIQYLGHLILPAEIQSLPEKLESIRNMPAPKSTKEIKQFLGLTVYYCKFVPRFSDLSRPLTRVTHKDVMFEWKKECQAVFLILKEALCKQPILKCPNTSKLYVLFTNASKAWMGRSTDPTIWRNQWVNPINHQDKAYKHHTSPHHLCKWSIQRKPAQLGCTD